MSNIYIKVGELTRFRFLPNGPSKGSNLPKNIFLLTEVIEVKLHNYNKGFLKKIWLAKVFEPLIQRKKIHTVIYKYKFTINITLSHHCAHGMHAYDVTLNDLQ